MNALFILYWRTTTNQFLFIYPPVRLNMRHWRIILHLFFIKSCDFFVSIFSFFFYYFYMHMYVKHPAHSLTHSPDVPKMEKNRVEGRVEHATRDVRVYLLLEKSNACSLLLLPLHVRCFLSAALVRRMVVVAHDRQIAGRHTNMRTFFFLLNHVLASSHPTRLPPERS